MGKMSENVRESVISNMTDFLTEKVFQLESAVNRLRWVKTVEEFMSLKKEVFKVCIEFHLGVDTCPYCMTQMLDKGFLEVSNKACKDCDYGKQKGICLRKKSAFGKLAAAHQKLLEEVENYW